MDTNALGGVSPTTAEERRTNAASSHVISHFTAGRSRTAHALTEVAVKTVKFQISQLILADCKQDLKIRQDRSTYKRIWAIIG